MRGVYQLLSTKVFTFKSNFKAQRRPRSINYLRQAERIIELSADCRDLGAEMPCVRKFILKKETTTKL